MRMCTVVRSKLVTSIFFVVVRDRSLLINNYVDFGSDLRTMLVFWTLVRHTADVLLPSI